MNQNLDFTPEPDASVKAVHRESKIITTGAAMRSLAELLLLVPSHEPINTRNLSCMVSVLADSIDGLRGD